MHFLEQDHDPQDPAAIFLNKIQDPQDPVKTVNKIQDPLDPWSKCQPMIQDPSRFRILDTADPGSWIFLGSWHMSGGERSGEVGLTQGGESLFLT